MFRIVRTSTLAGLRFKIDRLAGLLTEPELIAAEIKKVSEGWSTEVSFRHWVVAPMLAAASGYFDSMEATNHVVADIGPDQEGRMFSIVLQRKHGKSPAEHQSELEEKIAALEAELAGAKAREQTYQHRIDFADSNYQYMLDLYEPEIMRP